MGELDGPRSVRAIRERFKELTDSMVDDASATVLQRIAAVEESMAALQEYLDDAKSRYRTPAASGRSNQVSQGDSKPRTRFPMGEFLLAELAKCPKGLRVHELAALVSKDPRNPHKYPSPVVSVTLTRLKGHGKVNSLSGRWTKVSKGR